MTIVTDTANQIKKTIINHANSAILDPEMILTMSSVKATTDIDTMSHTINTLTCGGPPQSPKSDLLSLEVVRKINRNIEKQLRMVQILKQEAK